MFKPTPESLIKHAELWVGYLEKKNSNYLEEFTKNSGSSNYTIFNRDYVKLLSSGSRNMQWCGAFTSMMFVYSFGLKAAKELLCGNLHCYTPTGASYFKRAGRYIKRGKGTPKAGDVVFFWSTSKGRIGHVGIVYKVSGGKVYTIEGNTSGANKLVTNGGGVCKKSYSLTSTYIDGYGRPPYETVEVDGTIDMNPELYEFGQRPLYFSCVGPDVAHLQLMLISLGYSCGDRGADGDFALKTESALKAFEKDNGLAVNGYMQEADYRALLAKQGEDDDDNDGEVIIEQPDEPEVPVVLPPTPPAPTVAKFILVKVDSLNVRTGPGMSYKIVASADKGDKLPYTGTKSGSWYEIKKNNDKAWISAKAAYTKIIEEAVTEEDDGSEIDKPFVPPVYTGPVSLDLSQWNGLIRDGAKLKKLTAFVIHRASVSLGEDELWEENTKVMDDNGVYYGAYHYFTATTEDSAKKQAAIFIKAIKKRPNTRFAAIDCEDAKVTAAENKVKGTADKLVKIFANELKVAGITRLGIYIGHHLVKVWNLKLTPDFWWIPRYGTKNDGKYDPNFKPAHFCDLHQYTSRYNAVSAVGDSTVDANRLTGDKGAKDLEWFVEKTAFEK